jgi:hypothetical protein
MPPILMRKHKQTNEDRQRIAQLESWLAECYKLTGADSDGNEDWRLAPRAVEEVARLRQELDNAEGGLQELQERVGSEY